MRCLCIGMLGILLCGGVCAWADEVEDLRREVAQLKARLSALEERLNVQEKETESGTAVLPCGVSDIAKHVPAALTQRIDGLCIGGGVTLVAQGSARANGDDLSANGEDVTDGSYSLDLEMEKTFDENNVAFVHLEAGDGPGVEDELRLFSSVNRDAADSENTLEVTEAWYQHHFSAVPCALTAGKIDATTVIDANEYANNECTQFLGRIFRNSPAIEHPDNGPGLWARWGLGDQMDLDLVAMETDGDWEDLADDPFFSAQAVLKPGWRGRPGHYRLFMWFSGAAHTRWIDPSKTKECSRGLGTSVDQELTDRLGFFLRYGWQDPKVVLNGAEFSIKHAYSVGLQYRGDRWGRSADVCGCAFGQIFPSGEYKRSQGVSAATETHLELYYNYAVTTYLTLTPDLQVIWDPYGNDAPNGKRTVVVGGLRGQVDF